MNLHLSRRTFLKRAAAIGVVAVSSKLMAASSVSERLIGSQLYGWGQYYDRMGKKLYENLDEVFSALRDAGYDYAEGNLDVGNPEGNARFAAKLKEKALKPVALYTGGRLHDEKAEAAVGKIVASAKTAKAAGFSIINCNPDPIGREKTDAELKTQAKALELFGSELRKFGMKLGVHNHTPEMVNGARELKSNFANTTPANVGFCFDVHWVYRGGMAPMDALEKYGKRVVSWHLRQSRDKIWWEDLDTGDIDYKEIAAWAKKNGLPPIYTVELALENGTKITRSVVENHKRSLEFVKKVFV